MREREIFTVAPKPSSENWAGNFRMVPTRCGRYPELAVTPRTQSQFSRSTDPCPSSKPTPLAFSPAFSIFARQLIPTHGRQKLWKLSAKLVPQNRARDFQNAMMDLGALICTAHNPRCQICPVKKFCRARDPASLPRKRKRAAIVRLTESHSLSTKKGAVLLERCHHRWRGMWMLPPLKLDGLKPSSLGRPVYVSAFPFTHHRVKLRVFRQPAREIYTGSQRWFLTDALDAIPIPSPHRRAINALLA